MSERMIDDRRIGDLESYTRLLRHEMHAEFDAIRRETADIRAELSGAAKERGTARLVNEFGTQMRLLHQDLVERLTRIGRG